MVYLPTINNINPLTGVEDESYGIKYLTDHHGHEIWKQCSINTYRGIHGEGRTPLRKNFPEPGYVYNEEKDAFIPPESKKPFPSWVWNDEICWWEPPIPAPEQTPEEFAEGRWYRWVEETQSWVLTLRAE